jgi:formamidase
VEKVTLWASVIKGLKNPDLIVFPEVIIQGPDGANEDKLAEPIPSGPITQAMMKLARDLKVWLIPGTLMEKGDDGKSYNTLIVISPEGKLVAKYRKMYPARPVEPSEPGSEFVVFDIPGKGRIGLMICFDNMMPEVPRTLTWMGAEVIIKPTFADASEGGDTARTPMDITRAIEDQIYMVDVNAAAPWGNGLSSVVDPNGVVMVQLGNTEGFATVVLDLDLTKRVRDKGSWAGGYTFIKNWADLNKKVRNYPPYVQGIENGALYKTLSPGHCDNPSQVKPY